MSYLPPSKDFEWSETIGQDVEFYVLNTNIEPFVLARFNYIFLSSYPAEVIRWKAIQGILDDLSAQEYFSLIENRSEKVEFFITCILIKQVVNQDNWSQYEEIKEDVKLTNLSKLSLPLDMFIENSSVETAVNEWQGESSCLLVRNVKRSNY